MLGHEFPTILRAAQRGDGRALERLWEDLAPMVSGYLRLQGACDPDDLTSEVFIGVFRGIGSFQGTERQLRAWVLVIAHRRLMDQRRMNGRLPRVVDDPGDALERLPGGDGEADAMAAISTSEVRRLLSVLSDDQVAVLSLRILGDLTIEQIAVVLGKRPGAVKALQRRGLHRLRNELSQRGVSL
ncbi:MAG TPA: sigma-70 family RNA polymerase sigma factor [Euzebya sp.]|nr:sigma-70 family RNA polymerase sigma factor [Euzebya sp.]